MSHRGLPAGQESTRQTALKSRLSPQKAMSVQEGFVGLLLSQAREREGMSPQASSQGHKDTGWMEKVFTEEAILEMTTNWKLWDHQGKHRKGPWRGHFDVVCPDRWRGGRS